MSLIDDIKKDRTKLAQAEQNRKRTGCHGIDVDEINHRCRSRICDMEAALLAADELADALDAADDVGNLNDISRACDRVENALAAYRKATRAE